MASLMVKRLTSSFLLNRTCLQQLCQASKTSVPLIGSLKARYFSAGDGKSEDDDGLTGNQSNIKDPNKKMIDNQAKERKHMTPSKAMKYKLFEQSEEELILDYSEEMMEEAIVSDTPSDNIEFPYREGPDKFESFNLERGKEGVFDLEDLVQTLKLENMFDIAVIKIPPELRYCNYMVLASAKSFRHLEAVTAFLVKLWKLKKHQKDPFLLVEGEDCPNWKVIDMQKIVLHLFMPEIREKYDLESLWTLGAEFDDLTQRPEFDPAVDIMQKHMEYLQKLQPISDESGQPISNESTQPTTTTTSNQEPPHFQASTT